MTERFSGAPGGARKMGSDPISHPPSNTSKMVSDTMGPAKRRLVSDTIAAAKPNGVVPGTHGRSASSSATANGMPGMRSPIRRTDGPSRLAPNAAAASPEGRGIRRATESATLRAARAGAPGGSVDSVLRSASTGLAHDHERSPRAIPGPSRLPVAPSRGGGRDMASDGPTASAISNHMPAPAPRGAAASPGARAASPGAGGASPGARAASLGASGASPGMCTGSAAARTASPIGRTASPGAPTVSPVNTKITRHGR
jgi:hypothetical protein